MKKLLFTLCLGAMAAAPALADDYTVYNNGALANGINVESWWNASMNFAATNPAGDGSVFSFEANDGGTNASMGLMQVSGINTGILHDATLNFEWYATTTATYAIRLTAIAEEDYKFTPTADQLNSWQQVSLKIADIFPTVAQQWNENINFGKGYVFSVILTEGTNESVIYFNNINYTDVDNSWIAPVVTIPAPTTVPTPTQEASDVFSFFSSYGNNVAYGIGGWGQTTQYDTTEIAGQNVIYLRNFNYLGFDSFNINISDYDYMHVDYWTNSEGTPFGFVPISLNPTVDTPIWNAPSVVANEWNSYDAKLSDFNANMSAIEQLKFVANQQEGSTEYAYIANVYFWKDNSGEGGGDDQPSTGAGATYKGSISGVFTQTMTDTPVDYPYVFNYTVVYNENKTLTVTGTFDWANGNQPVGTTDAYGIYVDNFGYDATAANNHTITTNETYTAGATIGIRAYLPVALGVVEPSFTYTVGSDNNVPQPVITAEAQNITETTAEIAYEVSLPQELNGATYVVTMNDMTVENSPVLIEELESGVQYSYTLVATATLNGEEYASEPVVVTFTTKLKEGETPVYEASTSQTLNDVWIMGTSNTERKNITVGLNYSITYNANKTLTVEFTPDNDEFNQVVGMVPQLNIDGGYVGNFSEVPSTLALYAASTKSWTFTTPDEYEAGQPLKVDIFCAYDGNSATFDAGTYTVGSKNTSTYVEELPAVESEVVDIYTIGGVIVAKGVKFEEVKSSLNPGLYIVGCKKIIVR